MVANGMFSAGLATAVSVCTDVRVLILNVQQLEQEWTRLLSVYEDRIRHLKEMLSSFEKEKIETVFTVREKKAGHLLDEDLLNYWSSGMYGSVRDEIVLASKTLDGIRSQGIRAYLRQEGAMQKRLLVGKISQCRELEDRLTAVITCVRSEIKFSDERYVAGELTADELEKMGYSLISCSFRFRDGCEDPLDAYEVVAQLTEGAEVKITYYPVRRDGVSIRNECMITISLSRLTEGSVYRSMSEQWKNRLISLFGQGRIDAMRISTQQGTAPSKVQPAPFEPEVYAKRIAMKY